MIHNNKDHPVDGVHEMSLKVVTKDGRNTVAKKLFSTFEVGSVSQLRLCLIDKFSFEGASTSNFEKLKVQAGNTILHGIEYNCFVKPTASMLADVGEDYLPGSRVTVKQHKKTQHEDSTPHLRHTKQMQVPMEQAQVL